MIVVIQCAASKRHGAGMLRTRDGRPVKFVAHPDKVPPTPEHSFARPDDSSDSGVSWRQLLLRYNDGRQANSLGLAQAYELYEHSVYRRLVERFGPDMVYILSAGWGLIGAGFLTPDYDITFSASAEPYKRRKKSEPYDDFRMIPEGTGEPVVFFGGKDYVPLFCALTRHLRSSRTIFYNSAKAPDAPGCRIVRYDTSTRTNWHYECAGAFLDGKITLAI